MAGKSCRPWMKICGPSKPVANNFCVHLSWASAIHACMLDTRFKDAALRLSILGSGAGQPCCRHPVHVPRSSHLSSHATLTLLHACMAGKCASVAGTYTYKVSYQTMGPCRTAASFFGWTQDWGHYITVKPDCTWKTIGGKWGYTSGRCMLIPFTVLILCSVCSCIFGLCWLQLTDLHVVSQLCRSSMTANLISSATCSYDMKTGTWVAPSSYTWALGKPGGDVFESAIIRRGTGRIKPARGQAWSISWILQDLAILCPGQPMWKTRQGEPAVLVSKYLIR
jgi:hypothetical protein